MVAYVAPDQQYFSVRTAGHARFDVHAIAGQCARFLLFFGHRADRADAHAGAQTGVGHALGKGVVGAGTHRYILGV